MAETSLPPGYEYQRGYDDAISSHDADIKAVKKEILAQGCVVLVAIVATIVLYVVYQKFTVITYERLVGLLEYAGNSDIESPIYEVEE